MKNTLIIERVTLYKVSESEMGINTCVSLLRFHSLFTIISIINEAGECREFSSPFFSAEGWKTKILWFHDKNKITLRDIHSHTHTRINTSHVHEKFICIPRGFT